MATVGVGSVVLHGPDPGWALWFHDLSGLAVLLLVVALDVGLTLGWSLRSQLLAVGAGLVVLGVALAALPMSTVPIAFVLAPAAALSVLAVRWTPDRPHLRVERSEEAPWAVAVTALALGWGAFLLGRSSSAFCNPESVVQWHAVWHVLVAISAAAFAGVAFGLHPNRDAVDRASPLAG
jgi:hypothetical protein